MVNLLIVIIFNACLIANAFASCGTDKEMQEKLTQLKVEVACAVQSFDDCARTIRSGFVTRDSLQTKPEDVSCNESDISFLAVTSTHRILSTNVEAAILHAHGARYVTSLEEFMEHTRLHRARVKALGLELYKSNPKLFKGLQERQLADILESHDKAKASAVARGADGRPFYRILYEEGYGKNLDRSVADALNASDKAYMEEAMKKWGVKSTSAQRQMIERIEKIADFVDRGMSPVSVEEFGRAMERASSFMKDEADIKLALALEKKWKKVTSHLQYERLSPAKKFALSRQIILEEAYIEARRSIASSSKLSARLLANRAIRGTYKSLGKFLELLGSQGVKTALRLLEIPAWLLYTEDKFACSEMGYHDWVKDPYCSPAVGLTPKILDFLNEDFQTQKLYLNNSPSTCKVIKDTFDESVKAPKVLSCTDKEISMEFEKGKPISIKLNEQKQISELNLTGLKDHTPGLGAVQEVKIGKDGKVSSACFVQNLGVGTYRKCANDKAPVMAKLDDFLKTINYQLQKGIACCKGNHSFLNCQ